MKKLRKTLSKEFCEFYYWKWDAGKYQEYTFPSAEAEQTFVTFCEGIRDEN